VSLDLTRDLSLDLPLDHVTAKTRELCDVCRLRPIVEGRVCRVCADVTLRDRPRCVRCEREPNTYERPFMPVTIVATDRPALLCRPCLNDYRAKTAGGVYFPTWWR
jgi:hypothetical protein